MPSRKLAIAVPTTMLNILQPTNAKGNAAKTRNRTHAQSPSTGRKIDDQLWLPHEKTLLS